MDLATAESTFEVSLMKPAKKQGSERERDDDILLLGQVTV